MPKEQGNNAFPITTDCPLGAEGMTLRDYFAAAALQGICANAESWQVPFDDLAGYAWQQADAMLKAREAT